MILENKYIKETSDETIKKFGQYFTPHKIAEFMQDWILENNPDTILDPALGNGIFFDGIDSNKHKLLGYEIDPNIISFFKEHKEISYDIKHEDYLLNGWDKTFDAIICNPPYSRFQLIENRRDIYKTLEKKLDMTINKNTNLYILFLLKSISQLNKKGRIAYIIPREFLNTTYGIQIKEKLLKEKILKAIISFDDKIQVFDEALTTSCILLLEKNNSLVDFITVYDIEALSSNSFESDDRITINKIEVEALDPKEKWENLFCVKEKREYKNLTEFSKFAIAKRGIATGANKYFLFNKSKINKYLIDNKNLVPVISRSSDIKYPIFTDQSFDELVAADKNMFLFDGQKFKNDASQKYIELGVEEGANLKYLTKTKNPWYRLENKEVAPILINVFSRGRLKVVRNLTNAKNLTTFHGIYLNEDHVELSDLLYCYLLTDIGQEILLENKRVYGGGLNKMEPGDINASKVLNFNLMKQIDRDKIIKLYNGLDPQSTNKNQINEMNFIFEKYIL